MWSTVYCQLVFHRRPPSFRVYSIVRFLFIFDEIKISTSVQQLNWSDLISHDADPSFFASGLLHPFLIDSTMITNASELFIPARTVPLSLDALTVTLTPMNASSDSIHIQISPVGITSRAQQDLQLNPGLHSVNLIEEGFNASDWDYDYVVAMEIQRYGSVTEISTNVLSGAFQANRMYQWVMEVKHRTDRPFARNTISSGATSSNMFTDDRRRTCHIPAMYS